MYILYIWYIILFGILYIFLENDVRGILRAARVLHSLQRARTEESDPGERGTRTPEGQNGGTGPRRARDSRPCKPERNNQTWAHDGHFTAPGWK